MPTPRDTVPANSRMSLRHKPIVALAAGILIGLATAYGVWSTVRTPGDPRYIDLDYDGLATHYATAFLPIQHRPYHVFDARLFSDDTPKNRFGFGFARNVQDRWRLVAVGDIMAHDSLQISAYTRRHAPNEAAGGYDWLLAEARPMIEAADLAIGNLETVVSTNFPRQGFPTFNADPLYLKALATLGFDAMTTANNHILDFRIEGLRDTEKNLTAHGLVFTGTGGGPRPGLLIEVTSRDTAASLTVGILSYTDYINGGMLNHFRHHESLAEVNYICTERHWTFRTFVDWFAPRSCLTSEAAFFKEAADAIAALRQRGADYVAVFLHRLRAYRFRPSERERRQAIALAEIGADAIISTGSHSIMPVERLYTNGGKVQAAPDSASTEHLVVWGLGNFVSTQAGASAYGLVAQIDIGRDRDGRFVHAVTPLVAKSALGLEEFQDGTRSRKLEIYRLRMLALDAFLPEARALTKK